MVTITARSKFLTNNTVVAECDDIKPVTTAITITKYTFQHCYYVWYKCVVKTIHMTKRVSRRESVDMTHC